MNILADKFFNALNWLEGWLIRILLAVMVFVIAFGAINRVTIALPMPWSDELVRYLLPWMSFIAVAVGVTHDTHVGIDLLTNLMPHKPKMWVERFVNLTGIILSGILVFIGITMTLNQTKQVSAVMQISMAWYYASLPVGWFMIGLAFLDRIRRSFRNDYGKAKIKLMVEREDD